MAATTAAVLVGGAIVGAGIGLWGAYENNKARDDELDAQSDANAARLAAERAQSAVRFEAEKQQAAQYAETLRGQAGETQKNADISRQTENQELASNLDSTSSQSITANKNAAGLQGQAATAVSNVSARAGNSGLRLAGSMALAKGLTKIEGDQQVDTAKNAITDGLRQADSGATLAKQKIGQEYDSAMFNKNALLSKASQAVAAYEAGGTAYNVYKANDVYAGQLSNIQQGLIQQQIDSNSDAFALQMISGAFGGASSGLGFANSMTSLAGSLGNKGGFGIKKPQSLLTGNSGWDIGGTNKWDFGIQNGVDFGYAAG